MTDVAFPGGIQVPAYPGDMMARKAAWLIALAWLTASVPGFAGDEQDDLDALQGRLDSHWQLVKIDQMRNIRTWARQENGKRFRSFRVQAVLDVPAESVVRVMLDFENYARWYWHVSESRLLKKVSPTEYYVYLVHRAPFGLPDRDVILHAEVEPQTPTRSYITLKIRALPDYVPQHPPLVRVLSEDMAIRFTPTPEGKVLVESEGYIDPGGAVPSWATNLIQRSAPYTAVVGLARMAEKDEYRISRLPMPFPVLSRL